MINKNSMTWNHINKSIKVWSNDKERESVYLCLALSYTFNCLFNFMCITLKNLIIQYDLKVIVINIQ